MSTHTTTALAPTLTGHVVMDRILVFRHPEDERKRVYVSFRKKKQEYADETMCQPAVSFAWVEDGAAVEWEVEYGPIAQLFAADVGDTDRPGHIFQYHRTDCGMCWSQQAVYRYDLPGAAIAGRFDYIWSVLKQWHQHTKDGRRTYGDDA